MLDIHVHVYEGLAIGILTVNLLLRYICIKRALPLGYVETCRKQKSVFWLLCSFIKSGHSIVPLHCTCTCATLKILLSLVLVKV